MVEVISGSAVPDKVVITALIDTVLGWGKPGAELPDTGVALDVINQFSAYGRVLADDLRAHSGSLPILGEADRRLGAALPAVTPVAAAGRAMNLARLIQALRRATSQVHAEQLRTAQHAITMPPAGRADESGQQPPIASGPTGTLLTAP
ncbi:hypothetical protein [Streptomyces sp. NPDC049915]|uniref:hypothetical protein n=1 Tax=Streptomyces sp. NPDC049915 TaxID=3155510 RepID=UPI003422E455